MSIDGDDQFDAGLIRAPELSRRRSEHSPGQPQPLDGSARSPTMRPAQQSQPRPLVARYGWRSTLIGFGLLALGYKLIAETLRQIDLVEIGSSDSGLFIAAGVLAAVFGLDFLLRGLRRSKALEISRAGVSGAVPFGTKMMAWGDVNRIEVSWNYHVKRTMTVHGKFGAKTVGILLTGITVPLGGLDRSESDIRKALAAFAPHVVIRDLGQPPAIVRMFINIIQHAEDLLEWLGRKPRA